MLHKTTKPSQRSNKSLSLFPRFAGGMARKATARPFYVGGGHKKILEKYDEFSPSRQAGAQKLTNALMKGGKRGTAERLVRRACALFKTRPPAPQKKNTWDRGQEGARGRAGSIIHQAIRNVKPLIELRGPAPGRRGSRVKPKAVPILPARAEKLAIE